MSQIRVEDLAKAGCFFYAKTPGHPHELQQRQTQRLREISGFFEKNPICDIVSNLKVSLRLVDWLVTNYSRRVNLGFWATPDHYVNLHMVYRSMLKIWRRKLFDPFCRFERIWYLDDAGKMRQTTVGQLNFFYILIRQCDLLGLLGDAQLVKAIRKDMADAQARKKQQPKQKCPTKPPLPATTACTYINFHSVT
jgi:hypothetical protein